MNKFVEEFRTRTFKTAKASVKEGGKGIKTSVLRLLEAKAFGFQDVESYERHLEFKSADCINAETLRNSLMLSDRTEEERNSFSALQQNDSLLESTKETICRIFYESAENEYSKKIHSRHNYDNLVIEDAYLRFNTSHNRCLISYKPYKSPAIDLERLCGLVYNDLGGKISSIGGKLGLYLHTNKGEITITYSISFESCSSKVGIRLENIVFGDNKHQTEYMYHDELPNDGDSVLVVCAYRYSEYHRKQGKDDLDFTKEEFLKAWKEGRLFADISPDLVFNEDEMHPAIHFTLNTMSLVRQAIEDLFAFDHRKTKLRYGISNLCEVVYKPSEELIRLLK
ncbi:hypothetical protein AB4254_10825 [Vibrio breoganii]